MTPTRGFTLVEMLVALAVMALLAAVALPQLQTALPSMKARRDAAQAVARLHTARDRALASGEVVAVEFSDMGAVFTPVGTARPSEKAVVRFFPDGSVTGGALVIGEGGAAHLIRLHPLTGSVRLDD